MRKKPVEVETSCRGNRITSRCSGVRAGLDGSFDSDPCSPSGIYLKNEYGKKLSFALSSLQGAMDGYEDVFSNAIPYINDTQRCTCSLIAKHNPFMARNFEFSGQVRKYPQVRSVKMRESDTCNSVSERSCLICNQGREMCGDLGWGGLVDKALEKVTGQRG